MTMGNRIWLYLMTFVILSYPYITSANNSMSVHEVLSIKTGKGYDNIKSQFEGVTVDPYNGFAVDSKGNILISDTVNSRIMRFSKEAILLAPFVVADVPPFFPQNICVGEDNLIFAHNTRKHEIVVFSPDGKVLKSYSPISAFEYKYKKVPIISFTCDKSTIKVAFGVDKIKKISPVYLDEYDQQFKLINRKVFNDEAAYYSALKEINQLFDKHFEDSSGNIYGYPIVKEWYGKFLPLQKYSSKGILISTIGGPFLTKHTKYKVYDYYTMDQLSHGWLKAKGNNFIIVNWYVTTDGTIYVLLANKDYVKVLQIEVKE